MRTLTTLVALAVGLSACALRAAELVPDRCYQDDVMVVFGFDAAKANVAEAEKVARMMFGAQDRVVRDSVGLFREVQPIFDAGATRLIVILPRNAADGRQVGPMMYMLPKPGVQDADLQKGFARMGPAAKLIHDGAWTYAKLQFGSTQPPARVPGTGELMKQAIAEVSDQPFFVCWVAGDSERKDIKSSISQLPPHWRPLANSALDGVYLTLAAAGGESPTMVLSAHFAQPADAAAILEQYDKILTSDAAEVKLLKPMLDLLKPQQKEAVLQISLAKPQLVSCGRMLSPIIEQQQKAQEQARQAAMKAQRAMIEAQRKAIAEADPVADATAAHMRLILQQIRLFDEHRQSLPADLDELTASGLVPDAGQYELRNPRTEEDRGFLYQKPANATRLADIKDPATTPILYELLDGEINPAGMIGYADGHVAKASKTKAVQKVETDGPERSDK